MLRNLCGLMNCRPHSKGSHSPLGVEEISIWELRINYYLKKEGPVGPKKSNWARNKLSEFPLN